MSTQALSGAGFLKMINKATDAVSKMTIKMNESDVVSSDGNAHSTAPNGFHFRSADVADGFCDEEISQFYS